MRAGVPACTSAWCYWEFAMVWSMIYDPLWVVDHSMFSVRLNAVLMCVLELTVPVLYGCSKCYVGVFYFSMLCVTCVRFYQMLRWRKIWSCHMQNMHSHNKVCVIWALMWRDWILLLKGEKLYPILSVSVIVILWYRITAGNNLIKEWDNNYVWFVWDTCYMSVASGSGHSLGVAIFD